MIGSFLKERDRLRPVDHSKERHRQFRGVSDRSAITYSREYQIPDAPKVSPINTEPRVDKPTITIIFSPDIPAEESTPENFGKL